MILTAATGQGINNTLQYVVLFLCREVTVPFRFELQGIGAVVVFRHAVDGVGLREKLVTFQG